MVASSPISAAQPSAAAKDNITDPTLLDAAKTLDNFLLQYPESLIYQPTSPVTNLPPTMDRLFAATLSWPSKWLSCEP